MGCLVLPGCMGFIYVCVLGFLAVLYAFSVIYCLASHGGLPGFPEVNLTNGWALMIVQILSWIAYRSMAREAQQPWVYWITSICLATWCYCAVTLSLFKISYTGGSEEEALRLGSWIAIGVTSLMFLRFTFSRRNREYYRIVQPKLGKPLFPSAVLLLSFLGMGCWVN